MGLLYYWDLKDYYRAARSFRAGSERPGALPWMRALAAAVATQGGELQTSELLLAEIYRTADNDQLRRSAEEHLAALSAEEQIRELTALLDRSHEKHGRAAHSFADLVAAGLLRAEPRDPYGEPYTIGRDGRAALLPS